MWILLCADGRYSYGATDRFTIKAPVETLMIAPADGRDNHQSKTLPVCAKLMLAPMVVYLNRYRVICIHREIRCHDRLIVRQHLRITAWVVPYTLKQVIIDKEMYPMVFTLAIRHDAVERNPLNAIIQIGRHQFRNIIRANKRKLTKTQIVPVALKRFKRHGNHPPNRKAHLKPSRNEVCRICYQAAVKLGSYTDCRKVAAFSAVKPF